METKTSKITVSESDFRRVEIPDDSPDTSYLEQEGFEDMLRRYNEGEFGFMGIRAEVTIQISNVGYGGGWYLQTISSPGLWGVETLADDNYLTEVFAEECEILKSMLLELGIEVTD